MNTLLSIEKHLCLKDVAVSLMVSVKTVRRLIQSGALHAFKIGGRWFVRGSEIEAFIQRQLAKTGGNPSC
jgi:excisionase family DNA binding protein